MSSEAVEQFEIDYAPDCNDCGTRTDFRGIQENEVVQWICPECNPERLRLTFGIPEPYEVVSRDSEQQTLVEAATDGGEPLRVVPFSNTYLSVQTDSEK
jgi:hypothetical protein